MLEALKQEVTAIAKRAEQEGLCKHKAGNFSIRDAASGLIAVTPSGVSRQQLTPDDICIVTMQAGVVECRPGLKPTSELLMHLAAYECRADIGAVVHTHSRFATAFAVLNKSIPPVVYEAVYYGGQALVVPYQRPGTADLATHIQAPLQQTDACLLQHHGVLTVGKDLASAYLNAAFVEDVAEVYYRTLQLNQGQEPPVLSLEELKAWQYPSRIQLPPQS